MKKARIWELDAARGFCILCVIAIHLIFDLQYFLGLKIELPAIYHFIQGNGAVLFILISGICVTLGSRSFRRGVIVFACGMLITAVTIAMVALDMLNEATIIRFGILHLLGVSMMLAPLFKKLPAWALAVIGAGMIVLGYWLLQYRFDVPYLFFLGIRTETFSSGDYFPLLPFFGWFLEGMVLGRTVYQNRASLLPKVNAEAAPLRFFRFCGRHSLLIYLVHQPVCYGVMWLIVWIIRR